ncbi:F0F1 ATP synthase subunit delta [Blattabacterium cuenoti]|uniref:F0F1 ATP synthase subunit delta n=1 Tax=Blattabacterium cuenoti TaxID=1653831 RepID=UPI0021CE7BFF|nr:F0F1 ATP synthase subunit delta [Blattabacterium cuenoti]
MKLIIDKQKGFYYKEILLAYQKLYEEKIMNVKKCIITSSFPLNEKEKELISIKMNSFEEKNCYLQITNQIDKSIIGGFSIQIGFKKLDLSVKNQIELIKKQFLN